MRKLIVAAALAGIVALGGCCSKTGCDECQCQSASSCTECESQWIALPYSPWECMPESK